MIVIVKVYSIDRWLLCLDLVLAGCSVIALGVLKVSMWSQGSNLDLSCARQPVTPFFFYFSTQKLFFFFFLTRTSFFCWFFFFLNKFVLKQFSRYLFCFFLFWNILSMHVSNMDMILYRAVQSSCFKKYEISL